MAELLCGPRRQKQSTILIRDFVTFTLVWFFSLMTILGDFVMALACIIIQGP